MRREVGEEERPRPKASPKIAAKSFDQIYRVLRMLKMSKSKSETWNFHHSLKELPQIIFQYDLSILSDFEINESKIIHEISTTIHDHE